MSIGLDEDQRALASAIREWATAADAAEAAKQSELVSDGGFDELWKQLVGLGIPGIPQDGGSLMDVAVAIEACAYAAVPGPVLGTLAAAVLTGDPGLADGSKTAAVSLPGGLALGPGSHLLTSTGLEEWTPSYAAVFDLGARFARTSAQPLDASSLDVVLALAAAEAAGVARWSLDTAVAYARVREQFGRTIGSFQSIKHLCAQMLERAESVTALAWDAARAHQESPEQFAYAATAAAAYALDAAVANAQDCIQILGGIGFTWEHHAHLYLRRAMALRTALGGSDRWRLALADQALSGVRRETHVAIAEQDGLRDEIRRAVASGHDRAALADSGLLMPHWPAPYGRGAGPIEQIVIDEELERAGVHRPNIAIAAWALPPIVESGTDAQRERFVMPSLRGELTWCQLFSEPGAGSDLASLRTRAVRDSDGWRLTGQKVWTSVGREADWAICLARTNPDVAKHKGITYFLVDMTSPGIDVRPLRELTGEALFNEVFLDDVFVPDECVVGEVDAGWGLARTTLANERVAISGSSLGVSVELALASAGDPDAAVRLRLGDAVASAAVVKALSLRGTLRSIAGAGPGAESSVLKLVGVAQRQSSSELAFELLGAQVLLGEGEAQAAIQEALVTRCLSIAGGTTQVLRNVAAERILGLPRD